MRKTVRQIMPYDPQPRVLHFPAAETVHLVLLRRRDYLDSLPVYSVLVGAGHRASRELLWNEIEINAREDIRRYKELQQEEESLRKPSLH